MSNLITNNPAITAQILSKAPSMATYRQNNFFKFI